MFSSWFYTLRFNRCSYKWNTAKRKCIPFQSTFFSLTVLHQLVSFIFQCMFVPGKKEEIECIPLSPTDRQLLQSNASHHLATQVIESANETHPDQQRKHAVQTYAIMFQMKTARKLLSRSVSSPSYDDMFVLVRTILSPFSHARRIITFTVRKVSCISEHSQRPTHQVFLIHLVIRLFRILDLPVPEFDSCSSDSSPFMLYPIQMRIVGFPNVHLRASPRSFWLSRLGMFLACNWLEMSYQRTPYVHALQRLRNSSSLW